MPNPMIEVSWGEIVDRVTILELKRAHIPEGALQDKVQVEIDGLMATLSQIDGESISEPFAALRRINAALWEVEDDLRAAETVKIFDDKFIAMARSVYKLNDQRAAEKRKINESLDSDLREVKVFSGKVD